LPDLDNVSAVRDTVKRMITEVYSGRLHPRTAAGLAPLLNLQLRAIEKSDLERRIGRIEKQLNELIRRTKGARVQKPEDDPLGRRPAQAVKLYGSDDGKVADQS
jgi:hypothetical protein